MNTNRRISRRRLLQEGTIAASGVEPGRADGETAGHDYDTDAVLEFLDGKQDLGVHSEIFTEALPTLIEKGIVTGERKNFHPRKVVMGFVLGTRAVYDFVHDNAAVAIAAVASGSRSPRLTAAPGPRPTPSTA